MDDKAALINQLRIDRSATVARPRRLALWIFIAVIAAVVIVSGAMVAFGNTGGVTVSVATARAASVGGPAVGGSLLDATGYVVARRETTVSSKVAARVAEVLVEEGQRVEEGQIVARLDDSNARAAVAQAEASFSQAEASVAAAAAAFENAKAPYERYKALLESEAGSMEEFERAKTNYDATQNALTVAKRAADVAQLALEVAEQNLEDLTVYAPFAGVVTARAAQPGEMVSPAASGGFTRTGICTIVDMDSLEVEVDVSENFIRRVRPGQAATIRLNAYPDWEIPGEVIAVIPTADRAKATVQVRVGFKEKDERVIPQMGARVSFLNETPAADSAAAPRVSGVIVPVEAVRGAGESAAVFVINNGTAQERPVRLGARGPDGQTVLSGLSAGEQVAVGDLSQLTDGAKVLIR